MQSGERTGMREPASHSSALLLSLDVERFLYPDTSSGTEAPEDVSQVQPAGNRSRETASGGNPPFQRYDYPAAPDPVTSVAREKFPLVELTPENFLRNGNTVLEPGPDEFRTTQGDISEGAFSTPCPEQSLRAEDRERIVGFDQGMKRGRELGLEAGLEQGWQLGREQGLEEGSERGRAEGLEEGLKRGRSEGRECGFDEGSRHLEQERGRLHTQAAALMESFRDALDYHLHQLEEEAASLGLAIAARILRREVQVDPLLLSNSVRAALSQLAASTQVRLRVPAVDSTLWEEAVLHMPGLTLRPQVVGDPGLDPGECRMETELGDANLGLWAQLKAIEKGFFERPEVMPEFFQDSPSLGGIDHEE